MFHRVIHFNHITSLSISLCFYFFFLNLTSAECRLLRSSRDKMETESLKVKTAFEKEKVSLTACIEGLQVKVEKQKKSAKNLTSKVSYYKAQSKNKQADNVYSRKVTELSKEIQFWQDQSTKLEDQLQSFMSEQDVSTFHNGKYTDAVRQVYMELMCENVGSRKVETIVRTVLRNLAQKEVTRLPGATFAKQMLLEARAVAKTMVDQKLTDSEVGLTLGVDGTSKHQVHYGGASVHFPEGQSVTLGLTNMATGEAESYLNTIQDLLADTAGFSEMVREAAPVGNQPEPEPELEPGHDKDRKVAQYGRYTDFFFYLFLSFFFVILSSIDKNEKWI